MEDAGLIGMDRWPEVAVQQVRFPHPHSPLGPRAMVDSFEGKVTLRSTQEDRLLAGLGRGAPFVQVVLKSSYSSSSK